MSAEASPAAVACAAAVRARLARAVLGAAPPSGHAQSLGAYTLRPAQAEAVRRITAALTEFGGALLADPPGTGKTIIALALAASYGGALVIAPAALRDQWASAARRARVAVQFLSLEALSRGAAAGRHSLVIVDEAHHVRTPHTLRYRRLARLAIGAHLLLVTATPVVNRRTDRDALLALFLGAGGTAHGDELLARVVIRRRDEHLMRPATRSLPPIRVPAAPIDIAEAIRRLPPPFPARDGTQASALIAISLAMAWASSLAALDAALRRRLQRGEALADALREGRWPDRRALREWVLGDDSTQLAMPLLLVSASATPPDDALPQLERHLRGVRTLRAAVQAAVVTDTAARVDALRALAVAHADRRIVAFAQHAETVRALFRGLRAAGGVVAITGARVLAASGRWSRREVLRAFGPDAAAPSPTDPHAIRLLLTTDLLAEGVELQGAGLVVHLDAAWTPARMEQREGRAARIGAARDVLVTQVAIPAGAEALLRLEARLRRKRRARRRAIAVADADASLRARLLPWLQGAARTADRCAAVVAPAPGFLAAVRLDGRVRLIAAVLRKHRWRIVEEPIAVHGLCEWAEGPALPCRPAGVTWARRLIHRWCSEMASRAAVHRGGGSSTVVRAVRRTLDATVRGAALAQRRDVAARASAVLARLSAAPAHGVWREAERILREGSRDAERLAQLERLAQSIGPDTPRGAASVPRLVALLLFEPASAQPRRSSPTGRAARSRSAISLA